MSLDSVRMLSAYSNDPCVQKALKVRRIKEELLINLYKPCTKSEEIERHFWIILKFLKICQNVDHCMISDVIKGLLEYRLKFSILSIF